jgi:hypothetical protein
MESSESSGSENLPQQLRMEIHHWGSDSW